MRGYDDNELINLITCLIELLILQLVENLIINYLKKGTNKEIDSIHMRYFI